MAAPIAIALTDADYQTLERTLALENLSLRREVMVYQRVIAEQQAEITLLAATASSSLSSAQKPGHRHQWVYSSEEKTNGEVVRLHTCHVAGCRDVYREPAPSDETAPAREPKVKP
jgi:hypothetical protein